jgi:hypothetical protein
MPIRGAIQVAGMARKAIVVGPTTFHAYSGFAGGEIFTAPAVTGTDIDCRAAADTAAHVRRVRADLVVTIAVNPGEIACLATKVDRRIELLWHAERNPQSTHSLVARQQ